jgi:hypothetical protein
MGYILRIGFRHLEAIRDQVVACVAALNAYGHSFTLEDWLTREAPELIPALLAVRFPPDLPTSHSRKEILNYALPLNSIIRSYETEINTGDPEVMAYGAETMISSSMSDHYEEDEAGAALGGYWNADPFPLRAGMILLLGALEGFERGTIRILTGASGESRRSSTDLLRPRIDDFLRPNREWKELERRRKTFSPRSRAEVLARFGIVWPDSAWRGRIQRAWQDRNRLAHGFEPIQVKFSTFLQTGYDCFSAMRHLALQCRAIHHIDL